MNVRCERCSTEYEFDDALVSERGTTVECTNCGFKFKVYPIRPGHGGPERWVVLSSGGRELVYTSLRDLQKGIAAGQVGPDDRLSRDDQAPRPLRSIAELKPFFTSSSRSRRQRGQQTLAGVAPPPNVRPGGEPSAPATAPQPPEPPRRSAPVVTPQRVLVGHPSKAPRRPGESPDLAGGAPHTIRQAPAPAAARSAPMAEASSPKSMRPQAPVFDFWAAPPPEPPAPPPAAPEPLTQTAVLAPSRPASSTQLVDPSLASPVQPPEPTHLASQTLPIGAPQSPTIVRSLPEVEPRPESGYVPPFSQNVIPAAPSPPVILEEPSTPWHSPVPPSTAEQFDESLSDPDPRYVVPSSSRRARSRWIVGVVLVGVFVLFAATLGRRFLSGLAQPEAADPPASDGRIATLLDSGHRLLDDGDLEAAREEFVKASALDDEAPAVLAALARLETIRADLVWLELRLLDPADQDRVQAVHRELGARVGQARTAVQAASEVAPNDPVVLRCRVDWFRLGGQNQKARDLVGPLSAQASQPENAYILAVLDLADPSPAWTTVIARLRVAASAEGKLGRARAMLVYALARHGSGSEARVELDKLESADRPHPLLGQLKAFLERFETVVDADAGTDLAAVDSAQLGALDTTASGDRERSSDAVRSQLATASRALRTGDLDRAEQLYRAVLAEEPKNTEAMAGVAEVIRLRNDPRAASEMYERVLEQNPNYVPALIARADQKWASGDRAGALAVYRRVVEQVGTGNPYGARAAARIAEGSGSSGASPAPAPTTQSPVRPPPATTTAPGPQPSGGAPRVDTTDHPQFTERE